MANLSDAQVEIEAEKVGKELLAYIKLTQRVYTDYQIISDEFDDDVAEDGNLSITGSSSGRWAYSNNLEGYFDPEHVKRWLGVGSDFSYIADPEQREAHTVRANENYNGYLKLVKAIKDTGGQVDITYKDSDSAMDWLGEGVARLELVDGEVQYSHSFEEGDFSIAAFAEQQGEDEYWALEYLYGDEVASSYDKYAEAQKAEGHTPANPDTWYESIYEDE